MKLHFNVSLVHTCLTTVGGSPKLVELVELIQLNFHSFRVLVDFDLARAPGAIESLYVVTANECISHMKQITQYGY